MKKQALHSLLFQALTAPYGIEVPTNNAEKLRQDLYAARKADPSFACLSFILPPTDPQGLLWIIQRPEKTDGSQ